MSDSRNDGWTEIDMPFTPFPEDYPDHPEGALEERGKKVFGRTPKELLESIEAADRDYMNALEEKVEDLGRELSEEELEEYLAQSPLEKVFVEHNDFLEAYHEWMHTQPEMDKYYQEREEVDAACFLNSQWMRTGVLFEIDDDGEISQHLVGDVNFLGGWGPYHEARCEECNEMHGLFGPYAVVLRAKVVWQSEADLEAEKLLTPSHELN